MPQALISPFVGSRLAGRGVFSREQLEDSADGIRGDVRMMVDELAGNLIAKRH